jgi:tetratricopeptide (TPR) repeat protein
MIICPNCGAENLFDGATQCKKCLSQLAGTSAGQSAPSEKPAYVHAAAGENTQSEPQADALSNSVSNSSESGEPKSADFEIQEVQFDSGPSDVTLGQPEEHGLVPKSVPDETPASETIEKEMTLYRDDELQVRMEQTENGPAITLTNRADFDSGQTDQINQPETIIPALNEKDLLPINSEEQHTVTKKIMLHPNLDKVGSPVRAPESQSPAKEEITAKREFANPDIMPEIKPDRPTSELIDKISGEQFRPKSVAYFKNNAIKLSGIRLANGEPININGKEYELKEQTAAKWPLYAGIGAGVLFLTMLAIYFIGGLTTSTGQVVGVMKDPSSGQLITGVTVTIKELNKSTQISPAGFFIFDNIPVGIYTIEAQPPGYPPISDRLTVIKELTSTANFSLGLPDIHTPTAATPAPTETETENQSAEKTGLVKVAVSPRDARIFIDGKYVGQGNQNFKAASGSHRLVIKANGYQDRIEDIELSENASKNLSFTLSKKAIDPGQQQKTSLEVAQELEAAGKFNEALAKYSEIIKTEPNNIECLFGQARCFRAKADNGQALSNYLQAARIAGDKGDTKTQLDALSGVLEINPNYLTALYSRGTIYLNQGDYKAAAQDFSKVIEIDSRHLNAHYKLADAFFKSKDYAAALQTYEKTSNLNFTDPKPIAYMAETYLAMGDLKNVKKYYEKFEKSADAATRNRFNSDSEWQRVKAALGK